MVPWEGECTIPAIYPNLVALVCTTLWSSTIRPRPFALSKRGVFRPLDLLKPKKLARELERFCMLPFANFVQGRVTNL